MPAEARRRLDEQLVPYRQRHPEVRWTPEATWHLTLVFLGSVDPDHIPDLRRRIDDVAAHDPGPYPIRIDRGDGRERRDGSVAWLGLTEGAARLIALADRLAEACPPGVAGGAPISRTLSAHLTIARKASRAVIDDVRAQGSGPLDLSWRVDRLVLVRSHLGPSGVTYETLHKRAL